MLHLQLIEYSRHLESQKAILLILGFVVVAGCLSPKEKIEIACEGKGTYFGLSLDRMIYTFEGKTTVVPLVDYLRSLFLGEAVTVDKKKIDESYGMMYEGKYYEVTPIERRYTYSRADWITRTTSTYYHVTDPSLKTTVVVASMKNNPNDVVRQAHQSFKSYAQ